ncbi:MAG: radical SAM protein [Patescibacteria group bacterium]|nr:radical SAM protein [Patescibacteria group bacterium]
MQKFKIYSLGCKVNQYDGGELGGLLRSAGFILVKNGADLAIVNSCAVTAGAIKKNREMIKKARKENPRAKIILTGCWPRVATKEANRVGVDMVWSKKNISELVEKLNHELGFKNKEIKKRLNSKFLNLNSIILKNAPGGLMERNQGRSRYFLKVQDGCEQFCSYCIIPFTRGKLQSRKIAEVVAEAETAVKKGYREIILCGIHLGLFGINNVGKIPTPQLRSAAELRWASYSLKDGTLALPELQRRRASQEGNLKSANLLKLLQELVKIKDLQRIRLSSIEVTEVSDELINFMAGEKKMCRHLHVPLQSGCDKILRLMKRPYDLKFFATKIKKLRKKMPDIAISADVIVGFPGETAKDFLETKKYIEKMKFSRLHVFSFSPHPLTAAAKLPGRIETGEIKKRSDILRKIREKMAAAFTRKFQGKILEVVVEHNRSSRTGKLKGEKMKGKTQYYFDVYFEPKQIISPFKPGKRLIGQVIKIKAS